MSTQETSAPVPAAPVARPRSAWRMALGWWLWSKAFLMIIGWFTFAILPTGPLGHKAYPVWLNIWARWDSAWFVRVAEQGYVHGWPQNAAFFPLYPLLIRGGQLLVPGLSPYLWATVVAWVADYALLYYFIVWLNRDWGPSWTNRAVAAMVLFPTAFFFSVAYSEALFLALVLAAFYYARRDQWLWTGVAGLLAALTRNEGPLLAIPLALEYLQQHGRHWSPKVWGLAGPVAGGLAYMAYLQAVGRGAFYFMTAEKLGWNRTTVWPWDGLKAALATLYHDPHIGSPVFTYTAIDLTSALLLLGLCGYMIRHRYRWSYIAWSLLVVLIPLSSVVPPYYSPIVSMSRLILPAFPMYVALAELAERSSFWKRTTTWLFPGAQALFFAFWILFYWIA